MTFGTWRWWGQPHAPAALTPRNVPGTIFTRGWVDPRSEGNMSLKNPVTPPGIDPGTVRLVAERFNHYATPGPNKNEQQEYFLGGKGGRCVGWQSYHLHVSIVVKSGSLNLLESSGPIQVCNRIALPRPSTTNWRSISFTHLLLPIHLTWNEFVYPEFGSNRFFHNVHMNRCQKPRSIIWYWSEYGKCFMSSLWHLVLGYSLDFWKKKNVPRCCNKTV